MRDFHLDRASRRAAAIPIGPLRSGEHLVTLRPPRLTDGPAWRATCLDEQDRLEQSFGEPGRSWDDTVSLTSWAHRVVSQRAAARAGRLVPYVVADQDGTILGEIAFAMDPRTGVAELSLWLSKRTPKTVRSWTFAMSLVRIFSLPHRIDRIVAPVATTNPGPVPMFQLLGFTRQGTARQLRHHGTGPADHDIWWLDRRDDDLITDFGRVLVRGGGA